MLASKACSSSVEKTRLYEASLEALEAITIAFLLIAEHLKAYS